MTGAHQPELRKRIEVVLQEQTPRLMALSGVVSVAEGWFDGSPCLRVLVIRKTRELLQQLPSVIEGYAVRVDESGEVRALNNGQT